MSVIQFGEPSPSAARIKVLGVGGAGGNAVNAMVRAGVEGVEFISINTDVQALDANLASRKIQIGKNVTRGLGAGANPELGEKAIEEDRDELIASLSETDMVFITAGMGGGTGTGAAHVVAEIAKSVGALTVGIVTKPFSFEGSPRRRKADLGLEKLRDKVDTLIVIPNDRLFSVSDKNTTIRDAFSMADNILLQATRGISDIITKSGFINLDFADVRAIMTDMGDALMGTGVARGSDRALIAAQEAISNTLLEGVSIDGALGVLVNVTGSFDTGIHEVNEAVSLIQEQAGSDANIIFGLVFDDSMGEDIRVTVIATGFDSDAKRLHELNNSVKEPSLSFIKPKPVKTKWEPTPEPKIKEVPAVSEPIVFIDKEPELKVEPPKKVEESPVVSSAKDPQQIHIELPEKNDIVFEKPFFKKDIDLNDQFEMIKQDHVKERKNDSSSSISDIEVPTFLRRTMD